MKSNPELCKQDVAVIQDKDVYTIAYNKVVEDIKREYTRTKSNSIGNISVDFETAITKAGYGKYNYLLLLLTIPAASSSGWVTGAISFVLPVAGCDMNLTSLDKAWLNSAPYGGMIISAFIWGFLSDTFGRKRLLAVGFLLDGIMGILASLSPTLWLMVFFKFMSGMMNCGPYSIFMAYISEVFMDKHRSLAVSAAGIFSAIGSLMQPTIALALVPLHLTWTIWEGYEFSSWRLFLFICSLPSLLCGIASAFFVESPKFLLEKGRKEEALNVFKTIYTINTGMPDSSYPVRKLQDGRSPAVIEFSINRASSTFWEKFQTGLGQAFKLLKPPFLFRALLIFFIQIGSVTSLNALRLWLPEMFSAINSASESSNATTAQGLCVLLTESAKISHAGSCDDAVVKPDLFTNMMTINFGTLIVQCLYVFAIKYIPKKVLLSLTTAFAAACVISIPRVDIKYVVYFTSGVISVLNITFFCLIACVVEIFPTTVRATSVSLTLMFGRIGVLLVNIGIASIMFTYCDAIFYTSFCALMVITVSTLFLSLKPINANPKPVFEIKA